MRKEKYRKKSNALRKFIKDCGEDLDLILSKYENEQFLDGQNKKEIFEAIVNGNVTKKVNQYLHNRLCADQYNYMRDGRTPFEYGEDLILGWIVEDLFIPVFRKSKLNASLNSADKNREFLKAKEVASSADFIINEFEYEYDLGSTISKNQHVNIEIIYDADLWWQKNNSCHLRDKKFESIKEEKTILFGISLLDNNAFCIDLANEESEFDIKHIPSHFPYGRKPAYEIKGIRSRLCNWRQTIEELKCKIVKSLIAC